MSQSDASRVASAFARIVNREIERGTCGLAIWEAVRHLAAEMIACNRNVESRQSQREALRCEHFDALVEEYLATRKVVGPSLADMDAAGSA